MTSIDIMFTQALLAQIKPVLKELGYRVNKDAWVWSGDGRNWEFHGPRKFYWFGRADNAYDARYRGWSAYIEKYYADKPLA